MGNDLSSKAGDCLKFHLIDDLKLVYIYKSNALFEV